jgi:toxin ParE1/3/4
VKTYTVTIKPTAEQDLEERFLQIREDSPDNALRWYLSLIEAIEALSLMAERCPLAPEDRDIQSGIRHLIINNYRVLYRICGDQVEVLHIRHGARDRTI